MKIVSNLRLTLYSGVAFAAYAFATTAAAQPVQASAVPGEAQEEADAQPALPSGPRGAALGEIVVTAQRREESLQEVPIAVAAINAETMVLLRTATQPCEVQRTWRPQRTK